MNCRYLLGIALSLAAFVAAPAAHAAEHQHLGHTEIARQILHNFERHDYGEVARHFDRKLKQTLPPSRLEEMWRLARARLGRFQSEGGVRKGVVQRHEAVYVRSNFQKGAADIKVVFDHHDHVGGLYFVNPGAP